MFITKKIGAPIFRHASLVVAPPLLISTAVNFTQAEKHLSREKERKYT